MTFDTTQHITLENDRVLLRPFEEKDIELLLPFAIYEPDLWTYSLISGSGETNFRKYAEIALTKKEEGDSYPFIVFDKKTQRYAGSTRFYDIQPFHKTVQLGYTWYGKDFQGTGLNKHCKYLMLQFAFETLDAERVEFRADANNARSIAAMKSIGCTVEGILRSNCTAPEGRRSSIVLSILKDEWFLDKKQELQNKLT
ncbi:MAG: GNAT family N-acetyltransferase [Flavobacteriaceae bacterium]|nr:GNAT family N-acetyltransferase [Flavobacteriaceae bacterium]